MTTHLPTAFRIARALLFALALLMIGGCDSDGHREDDEIMVSRFGESESHNAGRNCMNCHQSGGGGEGVFVVAGTVYKDDGVTTNPGTVVRIYTEPNEQGAVLMSLEVDDKGNFYTTESLDLRDGGYVTVSSDVTTRMMISEINGGACNSCHGNSVAVIKAP
jgi:mono/diheme cytochrome c family protein